MSISYEVLKIGERQKSKHRGFFYYVFFKGSDGKSYRTCITDACRNFAKWEDVKVGDVLTGLRVKKDELIDADSDPVRVSKRTAQDREAIKAELEKDEQAEEGSTNHQASLWD